MHNLSSTVKLQIKESISIATSKEEALFRAADILDSNGLYSLADKLDNLRHDLPIPLTNIDELTDAEDIANILNSEEDETSGIDKSSAVNSLISLADKFDQEGKGHLSEAIDDVLTSTAGPKAPLKKMDDEVKKELLKFLCDSEKRMTSATGDLEELTRRLRYFDLSHYAKDMGIDRTLKDISKVISSLAEAKVKMFEISFGKKPSQDDLRKLVNEFEGDAADDGNGKHSPQAFFGKQQLADDTVPEEDSASNEEDISEDDYNEFFDLKEDSLDIQSILDKLDLGDL